MLTLTRQVPQGRRASISPQPPPPTIPCLALKVTVFIRSLLTPPVLFHTSKHRHYFPCPLTLKTNRQKKWHRTCAVQHLALFAPHHILRTPPHPPAEVVLILLHGSAVSHDAQMSRSGLMHPVWSQPFSFSLSQSSVHVALREAGSFGMPTAALLI